MKDYWCPICDDLMYDVTEDYNEKLTGPREPPVSLALRCADCCMVFVNWKPKQAHVV